MLPRNRASWIETEDDQKNDQNEIGMSEITDFDKEVINVDNSRFYVAYLEGTAADRALKEETEDYKREERKKWQFRRNQCTIISTIYCNV